MALTAGTRLGPYEILSALGAGGMGEVYRARDTKLEREVAIKVLPELFISDPERVARFQREAKTLAALNHPHIGGIYGLEDASGVHALVLELVEGPTLADRIAQGPIPLEDALPIAKQMAEALEAAHESGIIHRDLKPANIKLRPDGTVKVLDFGLAKALEPTSAASANVTASPTITTPAMPFDYRSGHPEQRRGVMTGVGMILGTAAYMSPEQAKGRPADKRSDIWAFGCVLYEMLAGKRTFDGEDVSDTLANILKADPDWTALPKDLPPAIILLLKGCLQKNRSLRVADVSAALFVFREPSLGQGAMQRSAPHRVVLPLAAAVVTGALVGAVAIRAWIHPALSAPLPVTRLAIHIGSQSQFTTTGRHLIALSPDGTRLAYSANGQLYLRALDHLEAVPIRGTAGATGITSGRNPFFSADGKWVGFWQDRKLKKVLADGGTPVDICEADNPWGATWAADNTIVYGAGPQGIYRVSANGGKPALIVRNAAGLAHGPQLLPDGRTVLFTLRGDNQEWDEADIVVQSLDTARREVVIRGGTDARYLETGHLAYVAHGTLFAVPFDVTSLKMSAGPVSLAEHIAQSPIQTGAAHFSISRTGSLAYVAGSFQPTSLQTLVWIDRQGRETPLKAPARGYVFPRISPDENRVALTIREVLQNIWMWDVRRETLAPLTSIRGRQVFPAWTRNGERLAFLLPGSGIWWQAGDGSGSPERLIEPSGAAQLPNSFAPDGRLVITEADGNRLSVVTLEPKHRVDPLIGRPGIAVSNGEVSPDGRLLAYQTNESGQMQVVVCTFPNVEAGRWQVSADGGSQPLWSRDGRELFYIAPGGGIMHVQVAHGASWTFSAATKLVGGPYSWTLPGIAGRLYDVSRQGDRFLVLKPAPNSQQQNAPDTIVVVQNWFEELKARVPTK